MQSVLVVVGQVGGQVSINQPNISRQSGQELLLDCPIESFQVGIVIGLPHPAMAMVDFGPFTEVLAPLRAMVRLETGKFKWRLVFSSL